MPAFSHDFPFDPSYGHTLDSLLRIAPPPEPDGFAEIWRNRYRRALATDPAPVLSPPSRQQGYHCFDLRYRTTGGLTLGGWLLTPVTGEVRRGVVVGHGYGGRDAPDFDLPVADAALLFPCFRGLSRSRQAPYSDNPYWHVLHDIDKPDRYVLGGCVEDCWLAVSALLQLYPQVRNHVGYLGISFGGGIGALAIPWDERIRLAHLNVPSFGHQPLRVTLPTVGSGAAVRARAARDGNVLATLRYYDAACAARYARVPGHFALALFDPAVAPPGQFAVFNAWQGRKDLQVLAAGHFDYPGRSAEELALRDGLRNFFEPL
jgi:cephalosporin-C deacetylase